MTPIGGYFEIESALTERHEIDALLFNSGRSAFAYLLKANKIEHVWLPRFNCDVMLEPIKALNIAYDFYNINPHLQPEINDLEIDADSAIVVNNYFGILDSILSQMNLGERIIYDNSQAYYSHLNSGLGAFNSFRKFFGLPDGASIGGTSMTLKNSAFSKFNGDAGKKHLFGRKLDGPQSHYQDFLAFEESFKFEEIKAISDSSRELYARIDHDYIKKRRRENFNFLHQKLKNKNQLDIELNESVPMNYPFLIDDGYKLKKYLIERDIFITTYWPNKNILPEHSSFEEHIMKNLVALPIDQRYGEDEMSIILDHIERYAG